CAVDRCQHRLGTMRESKFVEEDGEIGENDSVIDKGNGAGWIFVLKGNEHDLESGLWQGSEKGEGCKRIYGSDNLDSGKAVVNGIRKPAFGARFPGLCGFFSAVFPRSSA